MVRKLTPLTVPGNIAEIPRITDYVARAAAQAGLTTRESYYLCLAVDEIATNVVTHGYQRSDTSGPLTIRATFSEDHLRIHLEDTGAPFDPRTAPEPDIHQPPQDRQPGGLGIYLALRSVDQFSYARVDELNRSTFTIRKA
jgi:serine/threonine-protein kinase RsbW